MAVFFKNITEVLYICLKRMKYCQGTCVNISGMRYPGGLVQHTQAGVILLHLHIP